MSKKTLNVFNQERSFDEFDEIQNPPPKEVDFEGVLDRAISRRNFLGKTGTGILCYGSGAFAINAVSLPGSHALAAPASDTIKFTQVKANTLDTVTVPDGFNWHVVASWGDPMWSEGVAFDPSTRGTGESQEFAIGDNNDGMDIFSTDDGRSIFVVNNEYVNRSIFYGNRDSGLPENADDIRKAKAAHGISIFEITEIDGQWQIVKDSPYNRKITAETEIAISGPAKGHELLKTSADPSGSTTLGTWNNCGNGRTPWGTYLACEENFNGYFSNDDENAAIPPEYQRYGIGNQDAGYDWGSYDRRFRTNAEPNEVNRAGYVVEIDPLKPNSTPRKLTALGRFKHENAEVVISNNGKIVVYLGDDERGEYLYKYVSRDVYEIGSETSTLLDKGDLYVARFYEDGSGEWLILNPETTAMSQAEISIHTRMAASKVNATTMDRPEWVAANPLKTEAYCCLTNNKNRGIKPNKGGDQTPAFGPNPRENNRYGQIVRWQPKDGLHDSSKFDWDLFVLAGNPLIHGDSELGGSKNVNIDNMFNSPDGLRFDSMGGLWIQTDGKYSNEDDFQGMGNNQMLYADTTTGEIKRFLVGPKESEITGITWSKDRSTAFVGIQHPGEKGHSNFPAGGDSVPRSSIIAVRRDDGGVMG